MLTTIIVTHNSEKVLPDCLAALQSQTVPPDRIIVVDSGSANPEYLAPYENFPTFQIIKTGNIGFGSGNNLGFRAVPSESDFVLFLNPDVFPDRECLARALESMEENPEVGILGAKLFRSNEDIKESARLLDSTGIYRSWFGRWYDRGQGKLDDGAYDRSTRNVPAICGAFMFCRKKALQDSALGRDIVFDPDFFLYKEDLELSIRMRKRGWQLMYQPFCKAWHARGWKGQRHHIPRDLRRMAAWNEVILYRKHPSPYFIWALGKYLLVRLLDV